MDFSLAKQIWQTARKLLRDDPNGSVDSKIIMEALIRAGSPKPASGEMEQALTFLEQQGCLQATGYLDDAAVEEHGGVIVTSVADYCPGL